MTTSFKVTTLQVGRYRKVISYAHKLCKCQIVFKLEHMLNLCVKFCFLFSIYTNILLRGNRTHVTVLLNQLCLPLNQRSLCQWMFWFVAYLDDKKRVSWAIFVEENNRVPSFVSFALVLFKKVVFWQM